MSSLVLGIHEIEKTQPLLVGGKGLHLGELSKIQGIQVPEGFCVTTAGYRKAIEQNETLQALLGQLTMLKAENRDQIGKKKKKIRGFTACLFCRSTRHLFKYYRRRCDLAAYQ